MGVYAIGDVQGCYQEFRDLLEKLDFNPTGDRLWLVGDLVNRGPASLETLRFVKQLGDAAVCILGNHDLNLLAVDAGVRSNSRYPTLQNILNADDREELLRWLRTRPLLHHDEHMNYTMVHAGLPPQWDLLHAQQYAHEVENVLRSDEYKVFLQEMYGDKPNCWHDSLQGWERLRFITSAFTRIRYCNEHGKINFTAKGPPGTQPQEYRPWFDIKQRKNSQLRIIFGHWSTLGYVQRDNILALDSGCVWGGKLTAARLDEEVRIISVDCKAAHRATAADWME